MTKPKKYQYQIQYVDNTYRIVDWTKAEYTLIGEAITNDVNALVLDEGIFKLRDIRTIVLLPEPEELPEEQNKDTDGGLTEWGFVDSETAQWLKAQGLDVSKEVK